jgi:hypothetical protein
VTPAEALQYLLIAARKEGVQLTKTAQMRLLYLADLRAYRHGCHDLSGLTWERAEHGPFNRSVGLLPRKVDIEIDVASEWAGHARAVVLAYGRRSHEELGMICKGSAPMRKAPKRGDVLDLGATSTNDLSAAVTNPHPQE